MNQPAVLFDESHCEQCACGEGLDFSFTFAFQPIVDVLNKSVFAYEALVRGTAGEGAMSVLGNVNDRNRYSFDQVCRVKAVKLASRLGMQSMLSINFMPNAVYQAEYCIRTTLAAAKTYNFDTRKIIRSFTVKVACIFRVKALGHDLAGRVSLSIVHHEVYDCFFKE